MILRGFKFGMILQLAVGPISLYILQVALTAGVRQGLKGTVGVTLVDGLFIVAAILGIGSLLNKNTHVKKYLKYFGGMVLIVFGVSTILGVFDISFLPRFSYSKFSLLTSNASSVFIKAVIMTAANPLTIVFWAGVFSSKMAEDGMTKTMMYLFGLGAVLSTLICLTSLTLLGSLLSVAINEEILLWMNLAVGLLLVGFGIKSMAS